MEDIQAGAAPEVQQAGNRRISSLNIAEPEQMIKIMAYIATIFLGVGAMRTDEKLPEVPFTILIFYTSMFGAVYMTYLTMPLKYQARRTKMKIVLNALSLNLFYSFQGLFMWPICIIGPVAGVTYGVVVAYSNSNYLASLD